jgi:hypothetical protein
MRCQGGQDRAQERGYCNSDIAGEKATQRGHKRGPSFEWGRRKVGNLEMHGKDIRTRNSGRASPDF